MFTGAGDDTIVVNAHPTVTTHDPYALHSGDRIDLHALLSGMGYTGTDPIADGYIKVDQQPRENGQIYPNNVTVSFDPDGPGGSAPSTTILSFDGLTPIPHYNDGWLIV